MRKITLIAILVSFFITGNLSTPLASADEKYPAVQIIIDASGSMDGEKLARTKSAIIETIKVLPPNVFLRVIIIRSFPELLIDYTQNREIIDNAISTISASGNTSLYDAISFAVNSEEKFAPNRVVVLSDGKDTSSKTEFRNLLLELDKKNIPVDIVALNVSPSDQATMKNLTNTSGGLFFSTSNLAELQSIYSRIFQTVITSPSPTPYESPAVNYQETSSNSLEKFVNTYKKVIFGLVSVIIFVLVVIYSNLLILNARRRKRRMLQKKSLDYFNKIQPKSQALDLSKFELYNSFRLPRFLERQITIIAESRHLTIHLSILRIAVLLFYFVQTIIIYIFFQNIIASFILSTIFLPIVALKLAKYSLDVQRNNFANDLPNLLTLASGGLKSGLSIEQTFDAYSMQNESELAIQLRRTLREVQMGESLELSLNNLASRMENTDLEWIVTALSIQKNVGGSLADIIDTVLETLRSRIDIRREVRTLSAEGRLSAIVLIMLPISIFLFLVLSQKEYMAIYWTTPLGVVVLIFVGLLMSIGWIWMKKVVEIRV
jgi:tight adherence protein B